jgi:hypothetical protein
MLNKKIQLTILVATKDRPNYLERLLFSLSESCEKPNELIIISSGVSISSLIKNYKKRLPIKHLHVDLEGQSHQKKLGLKLVSKKSGWVMFCDDDVLFRKDTISNIFKECSSASENLAGIGINLVSSIKANSIKNLLTIRSKKQPGKIKKSGVTIGYSKAQVPVNTEWLNGLSLWRHNVVKYYNPFLANFKYAAYEDVFFSYKVNKYYELIYHPKIILINQNLYDNDFNILHYKALKENRLAFVKQNNEFSLTQLLIYECLCLTKLLFSFDKYKTQKIIQTIQTILIIIKDKTEDKNQCITKGAK